MKNSVTSPKYPDLKISLLGKDGNAFSILGACKKAAREHEISNEEIEKFMEEAMSGDYDHLLQTCMRWFNIS